MSTDDKINLAIAALGGEKHRPEACMCDPEVGAVPCPYCAELDGLMAAKYELKELRQRAEKAEAALIKAEHRAGRLAEMYRTKEPRAIARAWLKLNETFSSSLGGQTK